MSRAERVEAAWQCIDFAEYLQQPEVEKEQVAAALAASDAVLRTDAAVERVARAIARKFMLRLSADDIARAAIAALLDGEA